MLYNRSSLIAGLLAAGAWGGLGGIGDMPKIHPVPPWQQYSRGRSRNRRGNNRQRISKDRRRMRNRMARKSRRINRKVAKR